ncbi:hypothetical protein F1721_06740 [Saccharopolyspora hirsuta]|uniref:DUF6924 domain-containing protein n=1 Tax=Saccharopolyspora hirsuta TaxID=1837 RepID=A0A5M7C6I1_SACHI|nr:hypothetical protein [Saccharopolyspora hirsuta]KAA5836037.1 hypothetical protein F1721_06740 [Saccharopolyspora hirsuta]
MTALPKAPALVRTWFGDARAWDSLLLEVRTPSAEGFVANIVPVDDLAFEGLSAAELVARQEGGTAVSFLADERTLTDAERPVLAVRVLRRSHVDEQPFRVVPAALWSVENNISTGNMDWADFTRSADDGGVFRGF